MRDDTLAIRDRLLAVLRATDEALTTSEVCDRAGPYLEWRYRCIEWQHGPGWNNPYVALVECTGTAHLLSMNLSCNQRGYRELRFLQTRGFVRRFQVDGERSVRWIATGAHIQQEISELERMWAAS
jgi:hypothetical protein